MAEITDADAYFKTTYANKLNKLLGEHDKLQKMFPFIKGNLVGEKFVETADLEYEHGFTFGGNSAAPTLRAAISAEAEKGEVTPSQIIGRKKVGYRDLMRSKGAGSGDGKGSDAAFVDMNRKKFSDLALAHRRNIEISLIHGQSLKGIGVVGAAVAGQVITIDPAYWAPGLWMGMRNAVIDVYQSDGSTLRQGDLVVTDINEDENTRTVTVTGTVTGITTGDIIYRDTANASGTLSECMGLRKILSTSSGNLFAVSTTEHPLWKPNQIQLSSTTPTIKQFLKAAAKGVQKGLSGTLIALVPVRLFEHLNEQIAALREYDTSYKPQEALNGVEAIKYRYQSGTIMIVPHLFVFEGDVLFFPLMDNVDPEDRPLKRLGSVDHTFELPDSDGRIFLQVADVAAKEIRDYSDQALYVNKPGWCTLMSGIAYP